MSKIPCLALATLLFLWACSNNQNTAKEDNTSVDSTAQQTQTAEQTPGEAGTPDEPRMPEVIIEGKTADYSARFIEGLKSNAGFQKFVLRDSLLIINDEETAVFPGEPETGRLIVLKGKKDLISITLIVKKINYTTVEYKVEIVEPGKKSHIQKGEADISSSFFLGAESDESDTGQSYFVTEFSDQRNDDCYTYIRLGYEEETPKARLLGKLIKTCNGSIRDISLDDFPVLTEQ